MSYDRFGFRDDLRGLTISKDLRATTLYECDLRGADLSGSIIDGSTFFADAIFDEHTKMPDIPMVCPKEGEFIGYKKAISVRPSSSGEVIECASIVKLLIPADAKRSSATGRKCRCDKAKVLSICNPYEWFDIAYSSFDSSFTYEVGKVVCVDNFDECRWHECAPGIHFFMTEDEALMYVLA